MHSAAASNASLGMAELSDRYAAEGFPDFEPSPSPADLRLPDEALGGQSGLCPKICTGTLRTSTGIPFAFPAVFPYNTVTDLEDTVVFEMEKSGWWRPSHGRSVI